MAVRLPRGILMLTSWRIGRLAFQPMVADWSWKGTRSSEEVKRMWDVSRSSRLMNSLILLRATLPEMMEEMRRGKTKSGKDMMLMMLRAGSTTCMVRGCPSAAYAPKVATETVTGAEFQKMLCMLAMYPYLLSLCTSFSLMSAILHSRGLSHANILITLMLWSISDTCLTLLSFSTMFFSCSFLSWIRIEALMGMIAIMTSRPTRDATPTILYSRIMETRICRGELQTRLCR
mmetsp:Transcript_16338/g.37309  ORF Transcript_16338/g.37309 Transcript_16338/m.37309 type:complete len:232 (-) Transcript_16338:249-944(-)